MMADGHAQHRFEQARQVGIDAVADLALVAEDAVRRVRVAHESQPPQCAHFEW
jgi:hypothetical protein